jgi:hypothetical protein
VGRKERRALERHKLSLKTI